MVGLERQISEIYSSSIGALGPLKEGDFHFRAYGIYGGFRPHDTSLHLRTESLGQQDVSYSEVILPKLIISLSWKGKKKAGFEINPADFSTIQRIDTGKSQPRWLRWLKAVPNVFKFKSREAEVQELHTLINLMRPTKELREQLNDLQAEETEKAFEAQQLKDRQRVWKHFKERHSLYGHNVPVSPYSPDLQRDFHNFHTVITKTYRVANDDLSNRKN